ncbi:MAG TPA: YraN family protein [Acidimicrobiales bacterium]|jgi:putative endonuclease
MTQARRRLGAAGEDQAASWYEANGYEIVARNWRCREGEVDLILLRGGLVVVCEVKTRASDAFGTPAEAVTPAKQRRLRTLAGLWLEATSFPHSGIRFDVASILAGRLEIIEAAF